MKRVIAVFAKSYDILKEEFNILSVNVKPVKVSVRDLRIETEDIIYVFLKLASEGDKINFHGMQFYFIQFHSSVSPELYHFALVKLRQVLQ